MTVPSWLLRFAGHSRSVEVRQAKAAVAEDHADLLSAITVDERRFAEVITERARSKHLVVGKSGKPPYLLGLSDLAGMFAWIHAGTGAGKSRLVGGLIEQLVQLMFGGVALAVIVLDLKGELADLSLRSFAGLLRAQPVASRQRALSRLYPIRPFSRWLPELQLLAPEKAVSPLTQAHAVSETLESAVADLGIRQSGALTMLLALAVEAGLSLLDLRWLLYDEHRVRSLAARSAMPEARLFVERRLGREAAVTVDGVGARLDALLRVSSLKAALAGPGMLDLRKCFAPGAFTVIDAGGAPMGAEGAKKAVASLLLTRLSWAGFDSSWTPTCPTIIIGDEIQDALTSSTVHVVERVVTQGRFRKLGLWSVHQSAAQLPANLHTILNTNARIRVIGRSGAEDCRAAAEWLPTTGRVVKQRLPGEMRPTSPQFLTAAEELRHRTAALSKLPERQFVVADRLAPFAARVVVAEPFDPPPWDAVPADLRAAVERGAIGMPREELLKRAEEIEGKAAVSLQTASSGSGAPRRGRRERGTVLELPDIIQNRSRGTGGGVP